MQRVPAERYGERSTLDGWIVRELVWHVTGSATKVVRDDPAATPREIGASRQADGPVRLPVVEAEWGSKGVVDDSACCPSRVETGDYVLLNVRLNTCSLLASGCSGDSNERPLPQHQR